MKRLQLGLAALLLYLLVLVLQAPASLIDAALDARSMGRLRLAAAQGSVWQGQGQLEFRTGAGAAGSAGVAVLTRSVRWQLDLARLPFANLVWRLAFAADEPQATVGLAWSGLEISGLDFTLPAAAAAQVLPALAGYGLGGQLQLHVDTLLLAPARVEGKASLQWHGASSALAPVSPLGSYEFNLQGVGAGIGVSLHTLQGPLQLEGEGMLGDGKRSSFAALARVAAAQRDVLAPFLRLIAVENADGSFVLQLD